MLQGHSFRALLYSTAQVDQFYVMQELFHGLTAPVFLVGAGLTFVIATRARWEEYHRINPSLVRRVGRIFLVLGLGYLLHLPFFSLRKILGEATEANLLQLSQSDVLHCIGFGLLLLHLLIFFFRSQRRFYGLVLVATTAIPILTPLFWDIDFTRYYPPVVSQLLNSVHGSPFPLFPYLAFVLVGVIVSWEFIRAAEKNLQIRFMNRLFILGPTLVLGGLLLDSVPFQLYPKYDFWYTSPAYFAVRAGVVIVLIATFWHLARMVEKHGIRNRALTFGRNALGLLGKESLLIYVVHMMILYGSVINPETNLRSVLGETLGVYSTAGVVILFLASMLLLAIGWNRLRTKSPILHRLVQVGIAAAFLVPFVLREY